MEKATIKAGDYRQSKYYAKLSKDKRKELAEYMKENNISRQQMDMMVRYYELKSMSYMEKNAGNDFTYSLIIAVLMIVGFIAVRFLNYPVLNFIAGAVMLACSILYFSGALNIYTQERRLIKKSLADCPAFEKTDLKKFKD